MANPEKQTGTANEVYDLISIIYHALQGAQTTYKYTKDTSGDQALSQFVEQVQQQNREQADKALQLLKERLNQ